MLVLRGMFNPVDHQYVNGVPSILQPESQLFPKGSSKRGLAGVVSLRCFGSAG